MKGPAHRYGYLRIRRSHGICCQGTDGIHAVSLDAAFPILHGKNGEDGTVQGVLELAGIPVIGCGMLSSAVGMDKELSHRIAAAAGVPVAETVTVTKPYDAQAIQKYARRLGYPLFVKPVRARILLWHYESLQRE